MAARTAERRPLGALSRMSLVAGAHVALLFGIAGGLGVVPLPKITDITATFLDEPIVDQPEPPVMPDPVFHERQLTLPQPEPLPVPIDQPNETIGADLRPLDELPLTGGSAVVEPQISGARLDPRRPLSQPDYPPQLIRENAQGSVDVEVFVQPDGRVGDARILKSSGYEAFDRNTLEEAKRRWRLVPATRDGVAIPQWYRLRVVFKLKNQ
ncbi:MAG: TonB family protein [Pseudomonadota bacterium]